MKKLFVICGPHSSGNRAVAAAFIRGGCAGSASTDQAVEAHQLPQEAPAVWIVHWPENKIPLAMELNWDPELVIVVRDPWSQAQSGITRGHYENFETAVHMREVLFRRNFRFANNHGLPIHVLSYEGCTQEFWRHWLPTIGLRGDNVDVPLLTVGQEIEESQFENRNGKYYV